MDRLPATLIIVAVVVLVFTLMAIGWRGRVTRQAGVAQLAEPPADLGAVRWRADGVLYVATTRADNPLDRVVASGLGFRSRANLVVAEHGIALALTGAPVRFIPRQTLRGAGRATWTIDRVVEQDGLATIRWQLGADAVDSYFRVDDPDALVRAIESLTPEHPDDATENTAA